jgi:DNA-binding MarR family transcriptional regulator
VASRDERHTPGHTTDEWSELAARRVPKYLGRFQRELLMHLAIREARIMRTGTPAEQRRLKTRGLTWEPAKAVQDEVDYTPALSNRISAALRALEDLRFIRTTGHADGRRRTRFIKVTTLGLREAVDTAHRRGRSARAWQRRPGSALELDFIQQRLAATDDPAERRDIERELRRARRYVKSEMRRHDDEQRAIGALRAEVARGEASADAVAGLAWWDARDHAADGDDPWTRLEFYGDAMWWFRVDFAVSPHDFIRAHADDAVLFRTFREK